MADAAVAAAAAGLAAIGALAAACLIAYSPSRLAEVADEAKVGEVDRRDREYLVVAAVYVAAGWVAGLWALSRSVGEASYPFALIAFAAVMLLAAGTIPVAVAQVRAERTLVTILPAVHLGWLALRWPLVLPLLGVTRLCLQVLGLRPTPPSDTVEVQKQVMAAVADSVTEDVLADEEKAWIANIVALKDLQVSAVMTPRPDIIALPADQPLRLAVQQAIEHGFSRYPVHTGRIDEIVGIFHAKDALRLLRSQSPPDPEAPVRSMIREPLFVPETMGVAQLLRRFQAGNVHIAIVLDEYGSTAGLVSVEDVLEQIVGDLADEYDSPTPEAGEDQIKIVEEGRVLEIPARTTVGEVNQLLGTELPEDSDWDTVAGLVIAKSSRIPAEGEIVQVDGVEFRILAADERRLVRLRVTAPEPQPADEVG
jgi:CBS domain containing-hemolysin-like protein